jgi:hypothetical protein
VVFFTGFLARVDLLEVAFLLAALTRLFEARAIVDRREEA